MLRTDPLETVGRLMTPRERLVTGGPGTGTEEAARLLEDDFLLSLQEFEAGKLPSFSLDEFARADLELNQVYQRLKAQKDPAYVGAIVFEEIQKAQRSWLAYRDAWVAFGKVRYPSVAPHSWKTYFTRKRVAMLRALETERG